MLCREDLERTLHPLLAYAKCARIARILPALANISFKPLIRLALFRAAFLASDHTRSGAGQAAGSTGDVGAFGVAAGRRFQAGLRPDWGLAFWLRNSVRSSGFFGVEYPMVWSLSWEGAKAFATAGSPMVRGRRQRQRV